VAFGSWVAAAALFVELAAPGWADYARDPWLAVYGAMLRGAGATPLAAPPIDPADPLLTLLPGTVYTTAEAILSAGPEVTLLSATSFVLDPGAFVGPGPHTASLDLELSGTVAINVDHYHADLASPATSPFALVRLQRAAVSYDPAQLTPDPELCVGVTDVQVDLAAGLVYFTPTANAADAQIAFLIDPTTPKVVTFPLADSPALTLGKLLLVVGAGRATVDANALVRAAGTIAHPFDAAAALRDLGAPALSGSAPGTLQLIDAGDPGVTDLTSVEIALAPLALPRLDDSGTSPSDPDEALTLLSAATNALLAAEDALFVGRLNLHPYSLDFASVTPDRIRPERMGFLEAEYALPAPTAAVAVAGQAPLATTAVTAVTTATATAASPASPASVPRFGSVVDIERGGPAYLLLSIQINGSVLNAGPQQSTSLHNYSENSALMSISAAASEPRERQLIQATAYVQLNGDGSTLRLLDKQDDRSPVFYPSGMMVNWVRFMVLRPDGTPYNFHGKRTMVSVRFFSESDNPNFITASAAPAAPPQH
jgi:hypothetical protein